MRLFERGDLLDRAFVVGIPLEGLDGVLEVIGGLLLLGVSPAAIDRLTRALTQRELSEDPHGFLRLTSREYGRRLVRHGRARPRYGSRVR